MTPNDKAAFTQLLTATMELYSQAPSEAAVSLWWASLDAQDLGTLMTAFSRHIKDPERGRFAPRPADIIAQLPKVEDGHPGPEEAWSQVAHALGDERVTLVLTGSMKTAFLNADLLVHDKIAARMAFLEVYRREVALAREAGEGAQWVTILGHDAVARDEALLLAEQLGRLSHERVAGLLSHRADRAPGKWMTARA